MEKLKAGYFNKATGFVFCHYNKRLKTGEYWLTPEKYQERLNKKKQRHVERWANDCSYKQSIINRSKTQKSKDQNKKRTQTKEFKNQRKQYIKKWAFNKCQQDELFVLKRRLRARLAWSFNQKKSHKIQKSEDYIGISWEICREFIESQFQDGMNWNNRSLWHVDHFFPIAMAKSYNQLKQLLHFTNLRPMWAIDNMRKNCSLPSVDAIIERDKFVTNWIQLKYC
jgi:hypothetical protein